MPGPMVEESQLGVAAPRMRRISITVDVEIPETEFADLAAEALETGADLRALLASRYVGRAAHRSPAPARVAQRPGYQVRDFAHLFDKCPAGAAPYRGVGRAPAWLHALIQAELAGR